MAYQPIENYGIVGNMHTMALVGKNGSIDWFCFPRFDSPSVFAGILDETVGGHFRIYPLHDDMTEKQLYWPDTNVLVTRFLGEDGVGEIIDYMPVKTAPGWRNQLVRSVSVSSGKLTFRVVCHPAFNYARDTHKTTLTEYGAVLESENLTLFLATDVDLSESDGRVTAELTLHEGEEVEFVLLEYDPDYIPDCLLNRQQADELFEENVQFWRNWLRHCTYQGRWREMVYRSALTLKLLTYEPTGAIVAAPTSSLPEGIGGVRNWDYRYTWIRDAAFTLYGLMRIGFTAEAGAFMDWLIARSHEDSESDGPLQIMYGIDGEHVLTEETLDHLEGYRGSKPVRIGNGAYNQFQLDIYGELLDAIYLYNKYGTPVSYDTWQEIRKIANWVADNWQRPDDGIWEVRSGQQQFVYSNLMCWVALDRAIRLADKRSFPAPREHWLQARDLIYEDIMANGWNEDRQAFVQSYGSDVLDAANLMMPLVFFVSPTDPRMMKTIDAINRPPEEGGLVIASLVYRYDHHTIEDGVGGEEGTFNMCTFWLVEALTRMGRVAEARLMFERMLGYANHLGLYAEEVGKSGEALGNFPQAFTHLSLISAAFNLDRALNNPR